jgi:hypothetical protein
MRARSIRMLTAGVLATIGAVHVAWGRGSTFPFTDRRTLNDTVIGRDATPGAVECYAVAGALVVAAGLVADVPVGRRWVRRLGRCIVAIVLGMRGAVGLAGRTDVLVPGSTSPTFRRMDRTVFAPLCLALATGVAVSVPGRS